MKIFFRWAFRLFLVLIVLLVAAVLLLDTFAREFLQYQISRKTGLEVKIGDVNVGLLRPSLTIENLVIYNSADFGGSPFVELPELHIEYDRDALWSRKLHCRLVRFNLAQVNFVENKQGRKNFERFQKKVRASVHVLPSDGIVKMSPRPHHWWDSIDFTGIDTMNVTLGKATYLRMKQPEQMNELKLNISHQVFTNIKSQQDFSAALLLALLKSGANLMQSNNGQTWLQLLSPSAQ